MSHKAIAAALTLSDLSTGERLVAFSLASFANREERAWPGSGLAATRAGVSRGQYLKARARLVDRGLIAVEVLGGGRGRGSLVALTFAQESRRLEGEVNAELFELVLGYSRARGTARVLLAVLAALADRSGIVEGISTDELLELSGLADRTYRRAREQLLRSGDLELEAAGGGRARTNRWRIRDPRLIDRPLRAARGRHHRSSMAVRRPLVAEVRAPSKHEECEPDSPAPRETPGHERTISVRNPGQNRTVSVRNPGQSQTASAETPVKIGQFAPETPAKTPAAIAHAGREPQNPLTAPPNPPEGGPRRRVITVEEQYVSDRGRKRRRATRVDLDTVRLGLAHPRTVDEQDWRRVRQLLSDAVDASTFEIWLEPLELIATDQTGALLVARDPQLSRWIRSRFGSLLTDCAARAGRQLRVADDTEQQALHEGTGLVTPLGVGAEIKRQEAS